ncbi:MAG: alternative ribosome rescue aminoacyl-tRNA hydrolase ArfB [Pirellulales bacterium]
MKRKSRTQPLSLAHGKIEIPPNAIRWQFVSSAGPGGQHVNRTSSKAVLRFSVRDSLYLPSYVTKRIQEHLQNRINSDGDLVISSQRFREQHRNISDCLTKLSCIIEKFASPPRVRKKTKKPRSAVRRRLIQKRHRSETKRRRRSLME